MKIYIICSVRNATDKERASLEAYANFLEDMGHDVHLPHRDTKQDAPELEICMENGAAIAMADEIHVFYDSKSLGSHFDLGIVFALDQLEGRKKLVRSLSMGALGERKAPSGKSFLQMIYQWTHHQNEIAHLYPSIKESIDLDFEIPFFE